MAKSISHKIAEYIYDVSWSDLSEESVESAKLFLLDYIASAMAGYKVNTVFNKAISDIYLKMGGAQESSAFLYSKKIPAPNAALMNAAIGHGADMDDGHRTAMGHPGVTVIPVALALGEANGLSGKDIILSIVTGYQIFVKIASAINPSHFSRGFHTTGTVGTISAAATAAKTMGLPIDIIQHTLGLSCIQSAGLLEVADSGQMTKPLHPAKAAYNGIVASLIAKGGVEAPVEIFEGNKGFLHAMTDNVDPGSLINNLDSNFEITNCYLKLYPTCRHIHGSIDAAMELRKMPSWSLDDIQKIVIRTYPAALKLTGNIFYPHTVDEAKFSLPYVAAASLFKGFFTLNELNVEGELDAKIKMLIDKMEIISDPSFENKKANIRGAQMELHLKDGRVIAKKVDLPKGDPEVPVEKEDIVLKMRYCSSDSLSADKQDKIIDFVNRFEKLDRIDEFCSCLRDRD